jgi:hypothetical protein
VVEKHGRDRPRGSKNKPKGASMKISSSSSSASVKQRPGHPLGSNNKLKPSVSLANKPLDATAARRNTPPPSSGNIFSFFTFAGAQCREQQHVALKFTKFMDGQELRETSFEKSLVKDLHMRWRYTMMAMDRCSSGVAGPVLQKITICIRGGSCCSTTIVALRSLT